MEQELVDIMFQLVLTVHSDEGLKSKSQNDVAEWVRDQLTKCGYPVIPVGASLGVLIDGTGK